MHSHSGSVIVGASNSNHSDGCLSDAITHAEVVYKCSEPDESHERETVGKVEVRIQGYSPRSTGSHLGLRERSYNIA